MSNKSYQHPLYASQETVAFFKEQYMEFAGSDEYNEVDILLRPHLHMLNIHDDIATRFCCSGHPEDDISTGRFYILFSCTQAGKNIIENIVSRFIHEIGHMSAAIKQVELSTFMDIRYTQPHWCVSIRNTLTSQQATIDLFMRIWNEQIIDSLPYFHPLRKGAPL